MQVEEEERDIAARGCFSALAVGGSQVAGDLRGPRRGEVDLLRRREPFTIDVCGFGRPPWPHTILQIGTQFALVLKERAVRMVLEVNRLGVSGDSGLSRAPR